MGIPSSQSCRRRYQIASERLAPLRLLPFLFFFFFFTRSSKSESDEIGECTLTIQANTLLWFGDLTNLFKKQKNNCRREGSVVFPSFLQIFSSYFFFIYCFFDSIVLSPGNRILWKLQNTGNFLDQFFLWFNFVHLLAPQMEYVKLDIVIYFVGLILFSLLIFFVELVYV